MTKRKKIAMKGKFTDEYMVGYEPDWKGADQWSGEEYYRERSRTPYYYSYFYNYKDFIIWVVDWMKANDYSKEDIASYKSAPDWRTRSTLAGYVRALTNGMPENHEGVSEYMISMPGLSSDSMKNATDSVKTELESIIEHGKKIKEEKKVEDTIKVTKYKPTIQQLLFAKSLEMSDDIEEFIDGYDGSKEMLSSFDPQTMLLIVGAKPNHAKIIASIYKPMFDDFSELVNPPSAKEMKAMDEIQQDMHTQLKEGYTHLSKVDIKNQYNMYKTIMDACDNIVLKGKVTRKPRKKKVISAENQVSKFKYLDHHPETKSISVPPTDLIGANVAVVYNSKTRKLGIYYASNIDPKGLKRDGSGFSVKGTTITGFDPLTSVQKTLRKPLAQLAMFKKVTKRALSKEFEAINSVEIKLNGRFNDHSLIIKVF